MKGKKFNEILFLIKVPLFAGEFTMILSWGIAVV